MRWYFFSMEYHVYWCSCIEFLEMKNAVFLSQKVDGNMIFTDYWKVLVLNCFHLFGNEKYGLFWAKKLLERWYLLITEKFLFNLFRDGKHGLSLSQKVDGKMILTDYWKDLVLIFSGMGNTVFFEPKSWWRDDIYWLLRSSCFELFGDGKYGLFFS